MSLAAAALFKSTRGHSEILPATEAIQKGLASDGGLFMPAQWPKVPQVTSELPFAAFSKEVLSPFFAYDLLGKNLDHICKNAFNFRVNMKELGQDLRLLELFHGPTNAFKDFGARFLALCLKEIYDKEKSNLQPLVLVATSGDTGGAVASAFCEFTDIPVCILYPKGKISPRQEKQLTIWGPQVKAFAVIGDFDDCQRMVKQAFQSETWNQKFKLLSANSINLARLLPQMCYFAYASLAAYQTTKRAQGIIVPSGNLGNATAALWAKKLGFPIRQILCAHNANRAVVNYFDTGNWEALPTIATLANAMDVGNPSNFERMRSTEPEVDLRLSVQASSANDTEIRNSIREAYLKYGEILCPHTAAGYSAFQKSGDPDWILAATAHPAKFAEIVEPLIGTEVSIPAELAELLNKDAKTQVIPSDLGKLLEYL